MSIDIKRNQLSSEITQKYYTKVLYKKKEKFTTVENIDRACQFFRYLKLNQVARVIAKRKSFRLIRINGMTRRNAAVLCNLRELQFTAR